MTSDYISNQLHMNLKRRSSCTPLPSKCATQSADDCKVRCCSASGA